MLNNRHKLWSVEDKKSKDIGPAPFWNLTFPSFDAATNPIRTLT
jgi:hypothetical protein